jgi:ectoine hydroxylase-related dioxygenase (phytanoyl-CoA dioxygenase family)
MKGLGGTLKILSSQALDHWHDAGFLVLPGFLAPEELAVLDEVNRSTRNSRRNDVVVDDLVTGRRCCVSELTDSERAEHPLKVNDLYLTDKRLRDITLSELLGAVLAELLGDEAVICNSLNFDRGSQQPDHLDTLYMTPLTDTKLVATWMAVEDVQPGAGPLRYWPESNHIPVRRFSSGLLHSIADEMPAWSDYMTSQTEKLGLHEDRFFAKRGDVFIWHALLLHGGCRIEDPSTTRSSVVTHYWAQEDAEAWRRDLRPAPGGWWMQKEGLSVPNLPSHLAPDTEESAETATTPSQMAVVTSSSGTEQGLRDRMSQLDTATE